MQMDINREYIRGLLFEKASGAISEADNRLVESAIAQDEEIRAMWQDIQQQMNEPGSRRFITNIDEAQGWSAVKDRLRPAPARRRVLPVIGKWAAVAAVGLACVWGVYHYRYKQPAAGADAGLAKETPKGLQLRLANGQDISLVQGAKNTVQADNVQLSTAGNKLTYTVKNPVADAWGTLLVPPRLDYRIALADGTEVWLNAGSSLRFPYSFSGQLREVYLEGEAYFTVAKNAEKPFIVHAGETTVRVLGTAFNINAYTPGETTTSLVEGAVLATGAGTDMQLAPGYEAMLLGGKLVKRSFDATETLSWMNGVSYFHNTKLGDIARILSRWFDVKVVFDNPRLANETFSGAVDKNKPLEIFLSNIAISSGVHSYMKQGELHLE